MTIPPFIAGMMFGLVASVLFVLVIFLLAALLAVLGEAVGVHDDIHGRGW
ncbi:MAG: hypothetical protein ACOY4K_00725 [Pseudomonadota bacterium]